ncbi:tetratricopeptide repeat domain containing protein [Cordyceps fumosorosea ARSEF 2679]|uniref:Tetratricopeptide repeat domain containing protein n=1 Tax=Cordyceps fumosorosea (strain ARSEF 2679) TaxID=1081104 RepID=A0A167LBG1_CORFA|nr:tetratricopeptide repeat domain containing protein [Cordyceps fumosorosea ARSEF 2679]OAA52886.1 tetratricopeptide repeat domain containing protein [Cordyceps fumosorosea ARSEF 2679]
MSDFEPKQGLYTKNTVFRRAATLTSSLVDRSSIFEIVPMYDAQRLRPEALKLLELLAFLGTGLPEDLVKALALELLPADNDDLDTTYDSAAYVAGRDVLAMEPLIVLEGPRRRLVLLDALQDQVIATLSDSKRHHFFVGVTRRIWARWPAGLPAPTQRGVLPEPGRWTQQQGLLSLLCAKLMTERAWYQIERGFRSKILPTLITAMEIGLKTEHPDQQAFIADVHFCLGVVAMESNDFAVSRINKEKFFDAVSQVCTALGVEDERLAVAYAERGISRVQDAQYDEAVADLGASIRIMRRLRGGAYVPQVAEANMAWALIAKNQLEEAGALLAESLEARRERLGEHDVEGTATGQLLAAMAALRAVQGDLDGSHALHQQAWEHLRKVVGTRDPCTARVTHQLAEHLLSQRQTEEALTLINDALNVWSLDPLANQNEEARTVYLKCRAMAALGRSETAMRLRDKAIMLYNAITTESKDANTIRVADFDALVPFWSR